MRHVLRPSLPYYTLPPPYQVSEGYKPAVKGTDGTALHLAAKGETGYNAAAIIDRSNTCYSEGTIAGPGSCGCRPQYIGPPEWDSTTYEW